MYTLEIKNEGALHSAPIFKVGRGEESSAPPPISLTMKV